MYRQLFVAAALVGLVGVSGTAWSYDQALAKSYAQLFEPVAGAKAGKALHLLTPADFVARVNAGEQIVTLDVRTPAEVRVFTSTLPEALAIPVNEVFKSENLARIPTDKPVVVICYSGTRAVVVGIALRHIGFDNVYVLKGGFRALAGYLDPKTANPAPQATAAH